MANAGTITGNLVLRPDDYLQNLNRAADATQKFSRQVSGISFQGFNRGIIATTTLLYGMNRIMSSMSKGMEDFSNVLARIGAVADLTAGSVQQLSESMKSLSTSYGVGRTDIMKGMYSAVQSRFTKPSEMMAIAGQSAMLSRASGKEISVEGATQLITGLVRSLNLDIDSVKSGRLVNQLLKQRDIGRWELKDMATTISKVATVWGMEFADKLGGEETLRQMGSIMAVASGTGLPLGMVATGTRRAIERSYQLQRSKRGDYFRSRLRSLGYMSEDPIEEARSSGLGFYQDIFKLSGGKTSEMFKMGFQSRELAGMAAAFAGRGKQLEAAYRDSDYGKITGLQEKYANRMMGTYEGQRSQLRSQWEITSQEFMQNSIPMISALTDVLQGLNVAARMLPATVKQLMAFIAMTVSVRYAMNLFGFKGSIFGISSARMTGGGDVWAGGTPKPNVVKSATKAVASTTTATHPTYTRLGAEEAAAARLIRRQTRASGRMSSYRGGWGSPSGKWVDPHHLPGMHRDMGWDMEHGGKMPILTAAQVRQLQGTDLPVPMQPRGYVLPKGAKSLFYNSWGKGQLGRNKLGRSMPGLMWQRPANRTVPLGPQWYDSPGVDPMNPIQVYNQQRMTARLDAARAANNAFWYSPVTGKRRGIHHTYPHQPGWSDRQRFAMLSRYGALGRHFGVSGSSPEGLLSGAEASPMHRASTWGPTTQARIRWAAYKQGQSVDFATGTYGSMSPAASAYASRSVPQGTMSSRELNKLTSAYNTMLSPYRGGVQGIAAITGQHAFAPAMDRLKGYALSAAKSIGSFALGLTKALGPLAAFTAAIWAFSKIMEGYRAGSTEGRKKGLEKYVYSLDNPPGEISRTLIGIGAKIRGSSARRVINDKMLGYGYKPEAYSVTRYTQWGETTQRGTRYRPMTGNEIAEHFYENYLSDLQRDSALKTFGKQLSFKELSEITDKYLAKEFNRERPDIGYEGLATRTGAEGLHTVSELFRQAIQQATEKGIVDGAKKAMEEMDKLALGGLFGVGKHIADVSGFDLYTKLQGYRERPFKSGKSVEWWGKFRESAASMTDSLKAYYSGMGDAAAYKESFIGSSYHTDKTKELLGPFDESIKLQRLMSGMINFAQVAPLMGISGLTPEQVLHITGADALLPKELSPEQRALIGGALGKMDVDAFTETYRRPDAPFSQATYLGSQAGYNATLERKDDFVVQIIEPRLQTIIDELMKSSTLVEEGQKSFKEGIEKAIGDSPDLLKAFTEFSEKLDGRLVKWVSDPIVQAIGGQDGGGGGKYPPKS